MSVTLNEAALRYMLEDPTGPVGLDLQHRAEAVTDIARENAQNIIKQLPATAVDYQIVNQNDGLAAIIGITRGEVSSRWSDYLAQKEIREGVVFADALERGLDVK